MEGNSSSDANEKPGGLANWVGNNVASAFFASLESCSCVNVTTADSDDEEEEGEECKDHVYIFVNCQPISSDSSKHTPASVENLPV